MQLAADEEILDRAATEGRIVVSADTDFGTLLALRDTDKPSVVLFRGGVERRSHRHVALLLANLATIATDLEQGCVVVIEPGRLRVRRLPIGGVG